MLRLIKYFLSLCSLLIGFVLMSIKDAYQNLVLNLMCSALYKIGPNAGCDAIMKMPDFGLLFLIIGILGLVLSAYMDFSDR